MLRYPRIRRNNSQPLNIVILPRLPVDRHDHIHDKDEKPPDTEEINREDHVEDIKEGPVKKESSEKKQEYPEFLVIHTENVSRLLTQ